ncbi:MAG: CmcI family methyltransferase [Patescibacteria group bacterium]
MIKDLLKTLKFEALLFKNLLYRRTYINSKLEKDIVNQFHRLYYDSRLFGRGFRNTFWLGIPTFKCPLDLWIYQEIIFEQKPDLIIECGTAKGGSALFLASICEGVNRGEIVTIDIVEDEGRPKHNRITYLTGVSTSEKILRKVEEIAKNKEGVIVILDSDHTKDNVLNELRRYNKFVNKGGYLIVEDTNLNGHPVVPNFGPGPMEAVEEFMRENKKFIIDKEKEKFYLTFSPNGFLKRII